MYLRRNRKKIDGETYEYWTLVESVRTANGPRQRVVSSIGKLPSLDEECLSGWEQISDSLSGRSHQLDLFKPEPDPPEWASVDISQVRVERLRSFGDVYLGLALWKRLKLDDFFNRVMEHGREEISWDVMACILTLARFCSPSSELQIADFWYSRTALDDLVCVSPEKVNEDRLYRGLDVLLPHKDALFKHFKHIYGELFGIEYDILLYDITSTYFEGNMKGNPQAKRGYSRDSRPDCLQVCIGLVVTPEGLPLAYEVFDGNRSDVTTVDEIVEKMRSKYGHERRTWVMDRGMVSEKNIESLNKSGAFYLVGTPKTKLNQFEKELLEENFSEIAKDVDVKLCPAPEGTEETYILCRSKGRKEKEKAIRQRHVEGIETGLEKIRQGMETRTLHDKNKIERRIGALLQKNSRASRLYSIVIEETSDESGKRLSLQITRNEERFNRIEHMEGCYLLRTNLKGYKAEELWRIYVGLTEVEDSFRISKHDLGLRPVYHQKEKRTQAHILVCFLSLVLWRTLQNWMKASGLGTAPRKLLEEIKEIRSMDVVMPTKEGKEIRMRTVSRPEKHLALLLKQLQLYLPGKPKRIKM